MRRLGRSATHAARKPCDGRSAAARRVIPLTVLLLALAGAAQAQVIEFGEGPHIALEGDVVTTPLNQVVVKLFRVGPMEICANVRVFTRDVTARAGEDYTPFDDRFQWCPSLSDTFVAPVILPDTVAEPTETFEIVLEVSGGASVGTPSVAVVEIRDDDTPSGPAQLTLDKTGDGHTWGVDPLIPYRLVVRNEGGEPAGGTLTETVPMNTRFVASRSDPGWACAHGPNEGATCTLAVPPVPGGGVFEAVFAVEVLEGTPSVFEVFNEASLALASSASSTTLVRSVSSADFSDSELSFFNLISCCASLFLSSPCLQIAGKLSGQEHPAGGAPVRLALEELGNGVDGLELEWVYRLRDRILRGVPGGQRTTELFHEHALDMGRTAVASPALYGMARDVLVEWLPVFQAWVEGRGAQQILSQRQVDVFRTYVAGLESAAVSADLRDFLRREDARMRPQRWVGRSADWLLDEMNKLSCAPSDTVLCLNDGRFRVEVEWQDFDGGTGRGQATPLTTDTGTFWFFDQENVELVVKVLDARGVNGHYWVFYGALSDVEYTLTVTDTTTGAFRRYHNPARRFASAGDTQAFAPTDPPGEAARGALLQPVAASGAIPLPGFRTPGSSRLEPARASSCTEGPTTLCLDDRFQVEVRWVDFEGGSGDGRAAPMTRDTGSFWFFDEANVELVVKVLDARGVNGHYWIFYGALSDVEYELTVTDTQAGLVRTYKNPAGTFASVGDTSALPGE